MNTYIAQKVQDYHDKSLLLLNETTVILTEKKRLKLLKLGNNKFQKNNLKSIFRIETKDA